MLSIQGSDRGNIFYAQIPFNSNMVLTPDGILVGKDSVTGLMIDKKVGAGRRQNYDDQHLMMKDKDRSIWTVHGEVLLHMDSSAGKLIHECKFRPKINALTQGASGDIWLGVADHGLYKINRQNPALSECFVGEPLSKIVCLRQHTNNRLLVGTTDGLFTVDVLTKEVRLIVGTKGLQIKSIHVFNQNQIWFTAAEKGLVFLGKDDIPVEFPLDRNRYLASPHCVINDGLGYFWVPTNKGLFQIAIKDLVEYVEIKKAKAKKLSIRLRDVSLHVLPFYMYHDKNEGFNTNEFNGGCEPCGLRLANGYISFPSLSGLVWYRPEEINNNTSNGDIILSKAEIDQNTVVSNGDSLLFPANPENIKLSFVTAFFGNDYNLNLYYAIAKQNSVDKPLNWTRIDNDNFTVTYSGLQPGSYTLLIKKVTGFGLENYKIKKIYLVVPPLWHQTWWASFLFGTIFFMVLGSLFYFYNRHRLRAAEHENRRLEEVIVQRTASLNQALLDLEQSKTEMGEQMHLLSRLVTSITHDIQSPLKYIGFATRKIPGMIENNQLQKASSLGITISELSDRMTGMLGDLLGYIKVQVYGNRLSFEEISLKKLVDDKLQLFKDVIHLNGSSFINDVGSNKTVYSDYQFLAIIIHNLIDNAAKYTYEGKIGIYCVSSGNDKLELVISNTGTGISSELLDLMNTPIGDKSLKELLENGRMTGLGLLMVKEMAELVGIRIKVTQTDVTSFHLFF